MHSYKFEEVKNEYSVSLVTARLESGLSIVEWCERNDVTVSTYNYHARKLRKMGIYPSVPEHAGGEALAADGQATLFAELVPPTMGAPKAQPEVTVECGKFRILVSGSASRETLERVMEVAAHVG